MKNFLLVFTLIFCFATQTQAQVLNCSGSHNGAKITFLSQSGKSIKLKIDWNEGGGFAVKDDLFIDNGVCKDCPTNLGGSSKRSATIEVERRNDSEPVIIAWGGATGFCGSGQLIIPVIPAALNCNGSPTGSNITFLSKEGKTIKVNVKWDEGAGFNGKKNLIIENGVCKDCPQLGGIDKRFPRSATYVIDQTDASADVIIRWASPAPKGYCGNGAMVIPK